MSNQKRLKEYLVGTNGYLKSDISNGKVIMLSGKWGSGKTHFWQNKIQTVLNGNEKEKKIPNNYISLYGKTTIEEIRNEVFLKIFESMDIFKIDDKSFGLAKNTANLVADITKTVSVFGFNLDLSKIVDKSFEKLEKVREEKTEKKTEEILNRGAVICFDDFERKSKDIDLNDLFGFITHLAIEFKCKVVIILNDDVFEGEEKDVFSRVKEKSVSKFLKYEPSIKELFETIFENDEKYRKLDNYKEIILKTIKETQELNARIYIQVLDNLVEWIEKKQEKNDNVLKYFIFANIYFILNHCIFIYIVITKDKHLFLKELNSISNNNSKSLIVGIVNSVYNSEINENIICNELVIHPSISTNKELIKFINDNKKLIKILYLSYKSNIQYVGETDTFQKINNFIETGILINE